MANILQLVLNFGSDHAAVDAARALALSRTW